MPSHNDVGVMRLVNLRSQIFLALRDGGMDYLRGRSTNRTGKLVAFELLRGLIGVLMIATDVLQQRHLVGGRLEGLRLRSL